MSLPPPSTTSETPLPGSAGQPAPSPADAPSPKARPAVKSREPPKGCIFQIAVVVGVGLVLATLFTAWTPGQSNPGLSELLALMTPQAQTTGSPLALRPSPTFPPGAPTPTLRNPHLVGIVAGHWKNDSGTVCADGLTESALNLEIATRVQKQLVQAGYEVDLLAEFDPRLQDYQAAALVSIHNDSCQFINNEATGFKVASAMATRHPDRAAYLTSCLRSRYGAATQLPLHSTSVTLDMTSYHAFDEINENTPAAIIETGFLNLDRELLTKRPDVVAFGVASGILCYLKNEPISTAAATQKPTGQPTKPVKQNSPNPTPTKPGLSP